MFSLQPFYIYFKNEKSKKSKNCKISKDTQQLNFENVIESNWKEN